MAENSSRDSSESTKHSEVPQEQGVTEGPHESDDTDDDEEFQEAGKGGIPLHIEDETPLHIEEAGRCSRVERQEGFSGSSSSRGACDGNVSLESDAGYSSPERQESLQGGKEEDVAGTSFSTWEDALAYLGRNHALLHPFQEVKNKQLLKERDANLLQIRQAEQQRDDELKQNTKIGAQLYRLQQEVTRAQVKLDETKFEREAVKSSKNSAEKNLKKAERMDEEYSQEVIAATEKERKLTSELSECDKRLAMAKLIRSKCGSDLTSLRQTLLTLLWDRKAIIKTKDVQEFHLERLRASLRREDNTLIIVRDATDRALEEAREIKGSARKQEEELAAVERESKAVQKAWEENVSLIEKKSSLFSDALKSLISLRAEEANFKNEVSNVRKEVRQLQVEHEKVTHRFLKSQHYLLVQREQLCDVQENLIKETEKKHNLVEVAEKIEFALQRATKDYENECALLTTVYKQLAAATERHRKLEDALFQKLSKHTTATKAAENVKQKIKFLKQSGRLLEDEMVTEEQYTAREALKFSNLKRKLKNAIEDRERIQEFVNEIETHAHMEETYYRRKRGKIKSNANILDRLQKEVNKLVELCKGEECLPLEREERVLQLDLKEAERLQLQLEQEASSLQRRIIEDLNRKQNLERKEHNLKREVQLLTDRCLRLKAEAEGEKMSLNRVELSQKRINKARKDVDNQLHQRALNLQEVIHLTGVSETEQMAAIKELEKKCFDENQYLETLKRSFHHLEAKLAEATEEKALWEKTLASARKAKEEFLKEKGACGEMEVMKREITRMNVRWRALEATQKELSQRLVKSVQFEDAMKIRAAAVLESVNRNPNVAKATREMQIDSLKRKISSSRKVVSDLQRKTEMIRQQKKQMQDDVRMKQRLYMKSIKLLQEAENALQEKSASKHESHILLQEERLRLRLLNSLKEDRYRSLAANNEEAQKALEIRLEKRTEAYCNVVEQLMTAYPLLARPLSAASRLLHLNRD